MRAPVVAAWPAGSVLALVGPLAVTRPVARAILAELLTSRPPGALRIAVDVPDPSPWNWLAWVPHEVLLGPPGAGADLLITESPGGVPGNGVRTLLLATIRRGVPVGARVLDVEALPCPLPEGEELQTWVSLDVEQAARLGRSLAPAAASGRSAGHARDVSVFDLMRQAPMQGRDLSVPLGVAEAGDVWLDLREPAAGGDGPHGLLIGATGSGKSELLRSLVLGLAWRHPPEELAFVLADWKGGAAFDDVAALPHVAGLMTNLGDDPRQVGPGGRLPSAPS